MNRAHLREDLLEWLHNRYGARRTAALAVLLIVGLASLAIQLLFRLEYDHTALLYLAIPYCVAVLITLLRPYEEHDTWWERYISHNVTALVVFLGSSVVLFEGFICVLFFMPIYFLVVSLAFVSRWFVEARDARRQKTYSTVVPLLVAVLSLEGTTDLTTFERHNSATVVRTTVASPTTVLENLAAPFVLPDSDHWMLGLFPMPYAIDAGSLREGDVHKVYTRYHRWFVGNTHEGEIHLRIDTVSPERITTTFIEDSSYFSSYVRLIGSEIRISTDASGLTQISLTVNYERRLDPAWYFQPIQQYAMRSMANHLIEEVMIRD